MKFNPTIYRRAVEEYEQTWAAADRMLYQVCREFPDHAEPVGVHAKVLLIGRTCMTGIERQILSTGAQGSSISQLASFLTKRYLEIDAILQPLIGISEPLTVGALGRILNAHGRFVNGLRPLMRDGHSPRSFVAKYLHFHCPAVPIIDSYAARAIRRLVRWRDDLIVLEQTPEQDEEYWSYGMRFWWLVQNAVTTGADVTVRHLDYYLLRVAEAES